ncbi:MFS transporter, MCP family, solute carrier family 16 (Monocarboxylic acid transporters), member 10 [Pleurostoma richardsiae]|uniref:MFS transporter, MCP family, solute carrier family 16 (Monocarboxylic acid transporters), member 10 n=1 Tax=Pleurostoma richardsiae TaxID=41990 RepID=A0AA38RKE2_9PEZI|nr:MFS transporter, MCP family, solute carrier family 16 (Monocarboxylic acid transporters), member 10 [Pleurostoma richardsiae]
MSKPATEESKLVLTDDGTILTTATASDEVVDYPDGGKRAWLTVLGSFCMFFAGLSLMNSIGAYETWISGHQLANESPGRIGWIFGFYNFMSFFAGIPLGPVFDVKGPLPLLLVGSVLLIATYLLLSICKVYWHFLLCLGLVGSLSTCLLFTASVGTIQHWFLRRRGIATGCAISGGSVGGIVFPLILGKLLPRIGFAWTMRVTTLIMLPCLAAGCLLLRGRLQRAFSWKGILPNPRLLLNPQLSVLTAGAFFVELGLFIPMTYIASYAVANGASSQAAYNVVTLLNVGSFIGRWLPGYIGDKLGRFNAQVCALFLSLVAIFGIWKQAGTSTGALFAFAVVFGIGSGSGISLVPVCIAQLCDTKDYGKTFTAVYSIASIGSLIGVPLGGRILESSNGEYSGLIMFAGSAYVVALLCFIAVRIMGIGVSPIKKF